MVRTQNEGTTSILKLFTSKSIFIYMKHEKAASAAYVKSDVGRYSYRSATFPAKISRE